MGVFVTIINRIVKEQELIIGPIAWDEAKKVDGLAVNKEKHTVQFQNNNEEVVVGRLVQQYERLFGRASREVCKEAVKDLIADLPQNKIPSALQ